MNPRSRRKSRILIIDDHPVVRKGLSLLMERTPDMMVCAEAEEASQIFKLVERSKPHASVLDLSLNDGSALNVLRELRREHSKIPVVIFSVSEEAHFGVRAIQAGAMGYVNK